MTQLNSVEIFLEYNRHQPNMKCENCGHSLKKHHLGGQGDTDWCSHGMTKKSKTTACKCYDFYNRKQVNP